MDNPLGGIPPEDLPEPLRRLLEEAAARGDKVRILPMGQAPAGILSQVMELAKDDEQARLQCGCHWCTLEHEVSLVNKTTELAPDQKYEAVDRLFIESAQQSQDKGDDGAAFSKRMQALAYKANQANRSWFLQACEARIGATVQVAAEHFGLPKSDPDEVLRTLARTAVEQSRAANDPGPMITCATLALTLKDLLELRRTLSSRAPEFKVVRAENGADLAGAI